MLRKRFFETSRGRIVALLQRGELTVERMSSEMAVTPNAVRAQLIGMERDGLVRRAGNKRAGATRPSQLFELTPEVHQLLSRAYIPLLTYLLHVLTTRQSTAQVNRLMRETGKALAAEFPAADRLSNAPLSGRVQAVSTFLNTELGAVTEVVKDNGHFVIQGVSCPLSAITGKHRAVCLAIESMVHEIVGAPVRECCARSERPRCCFQVGE